MIPYSLSTWMLFSCTSLRQQTNNASKQFCMYKAAAAAATAKECTKLHLIQTLTATHRLTGIHRNQQKSWKSDITHHHTAYVSIIISTEMTQFRLRSFSCWKPLTGNSGINFVHITAFQQMDIFLVIIAAYLLNIMFITEHKFCTASISVP